MCVLKISLSTVLVKSYIYSYCINNAHKTNYVYILYLVILIMYIHSAQSWKWNR